MDGWIIYLKIFVTYYKKFFSKIYHHNQYSHTESYKIIQINDKLYSQTFDEIIFSGGSGDGCRNKKVILDCRVIRKREYYRSVTAPIKPGCMSLVV